MRGWARGLALLLMAAAPAIQAAAPSDDWCADAVDFAMGAAQNRELGYTLEVIAGSVDRNPSYYQRMFERLSAEDMKQIAATVYRMQWTRFGAAQGMTESCQPQ